MQRVCALGAAIVTATRTFIPPGELFGRTVLLLTSLAERQRRVRESPVRAEEKSLISSHLERQRWICLLSPGS